jgi:hypothetical protein
MRLNKFIWIAGFVAAFAVPLAAQQPQELTFKVTPAELDVLAKGLESQPYKDVVPLLQKLREQFAAQQQPPKPATPVPEQKKE